MKPESTDLLAAQSQSQEPQPSTHQWLIGAIALVILLALIVLLGWMVSNPMLKSGFPGSPATMKANTALCFLLSGIALGLIQIKKTTLKKKLKFLILTFTCLILLIALLTLSEYGFGWNLGLDQLLFQDAAPSAASPYSGRMGVNTAFNFGLTGAAILLLSHKAKYSDWLAQSLGFMIGLIALLALIGHLFGVNLFQRAVVISTTMAIHTAIAFLLLSGIILLMHPQRGFVRSLTSPLMGGLMARWMLPWAIGFPVIFGWLILQGERHGWYDPAFMSALQVIVMTLTFTILIGGTAHSMNRINMVLRQSQIELKQANETLETRVGERTVDILKANDRLQIELFERGRAEQAWRESEERLQTFMDYTPAPSWITDIDGQILYLNRAYFQTFQLPAGDPIGKTVFDLYSAEYAQQFLDNIRRVAETNEVVEAIEVAPRLDGTIANFLVYKFPMRSATGQCLVSGIAVDITDRQRAETELRAMSAVMENAVEGISRLDPQGRYTFVNPAYAHAVGYEPEEMLGMDWQHTVHPDDVEPMIAAYHQMLRDGKVEAEARGIRKDGSLFYKQLVMISAYDEQQQCNGHHCFMKDISERKRVEEYLRQSEEIHAQLAAIVEASDDALIRKGLDGTILSWNRGAEKIFGYTAEEIVGRSIAMLIPPDRVNEIPQILNQVRQGKSVKHYETERLRKDGQRINISITASPIRDDRGKVIAASVVKRDITNQKRAEAALQQSEARNRALIEALPDLLIQMRSDGTYLDFVSGSNVKLLNPEQFYPGTHIDNVMPQDLAQERMTHIQQALETGEVQVYEYELPANGTISVEEARIAPCGEAEVLVIVRDITERKQAETALQDLAHKLEQSNQELQNFAFVASHDLKEPLRTIRNFSNLLQSRCGKQLSDQGKDYLGRMQSAAQRMQALIDGLLSLSRVTSQAQPFVSVDLNQVVQSVLSGLEMKIQETHAVVEVEPLPTLTADSTQMHQLLQNLISNALKFHGDKPPNITIHSQVLPQPSPKQNVITKPMVQISIQDEGIGFNEQYSDRIFKIFERLHGRSEYEGTGIGLAVCRKIVERHSGSISAHSTPGQGSTFTITLPMKQLVPPS